MSEEKKTILTAAIQQRIRQRREDFGASVEDMAGWSGLPIERWRNIEAGDSLSTAELGKVARALAIDVGSLLKGEDRSVRRSAVRFRQAAGIFPGTRVPEMRTLSVAAELGRIGGGLLRHLGRPLPLANARIGRPLPENEAPWKHGYRLGDDARQRLGLGVRPIKNLQSTFEKEGIHVATLDFSQPSIDAASLMEEGAMPMILLNARSPRTSFALPRRATLAHELCHLLYDSGEHDLATRLSGDSGSAHEDGIEQRARAFAPAFLAPPDAVRQWFRSGRGRHLRDPQRKVESLAKRWGLSLEGAIWHAKNCGVILGTTADRLISGLRVGAESRANWQGDFECQEPSESTSTLGIKAVPLCQGLLATVVHEAAAAGAISEGRAREILTWS